MMNRLNEQADRPQSLQAVYDKWLLEEQNHRPISKGTVDRVMELVAWLDSHADDACMGSDGAFFREAPERRLASAIRAALDAHPHPPATERSEVATKPESSRKGWFRSLGFWY